MRPFLVRAIWVWVAFRVLSVLNGALRDFVYVPEWGAIAGRVAGTGILLVVMLIVMYVFLRRNAQALTRLRVVELGLLWVGLSVFFEFADTRWVMEENWETILSHYNVMLGRFHVVVRLVEFIGPIVLGGRLISRREMRELASRDDEENLPTTPADEAPPEESGA